MTNRKGCSTQREEIEKECRRAVKEFQRVFGSDAKPEFGSYAPGRVNLMGGSIDYSGGPVIPVVSLWDNRLNNVVASTDLATVKQLGLLTTYPDYSLNGLRGYGVLKSCSVYTTPTPRQREAAAVYHKLHNPPR